MFICTYIVNVASCHRMTSKSEHLKVVGKSAHFVWWCRAILAPVVICDIKATPFFVNFGNQQRSLAASLATSSESRCQAPSGFIWGTWTRKAGRWSGCKAVFPLNGEVGGGGVLTLWRRKWRASVLTAGWPKSFSCAKYQLLLGFTLFVPNIQDVNTTIQSVHFSCLNKSCMHFKICYSINTLILPGVSLQDTHPLCVQHTRLHTFVYTHEMHSLGHILQVFTLPQTTYLCQILGVRIICVCVCVWPCGQYSSVL